MNLLHPASRIAVIVRVLAATGLASLGLACAGAGAARDAEPVDFEIRGVAVDARTRQPAVAVLVRLPELGLGDATDAAGAFRIRGHAAPGAYVLTAARIGYTPMRRRIRVRAGTLNVRTFSMREQVMQLDDATVAECVRHDRPPADTAPGATVRADSDSAGAFWMVCQPPPG